MSFGSSASARAIPMRWRCPPENSCGKRLRCSCCSPTRSSSSAERAAISALPTPCRASGAPMIWPIRLRGFSDANGSWKTICISRRTGLSFARPAFVMSTPRKLIVPPVGSSRRMSVRDSVVLPQPDSPTRPSVSPSRRCSVTSSTACTCATARSNSSPFLIGKYCLRCSAASRTGRSALALSTGTLFAVALTPSRPRRRARSARRSRAARACAPRSARSGPRGPSRPRPARAARA